MFFEGGILYVWFKSTKNNKCIFYHLKDWTNEEKVYKKLQILDRKKEKLL